MKSNAMLIVKIKKKEGQGLKKDKSILRKYQRKYLVGTEFTADFVNLELSNLEDVHTGMFSSEGTQGMKTFPCAHLEHLDSTFCLLRCDIVEHSFL